MSGRSSTDSLRRLAPVSDSDAAALFGAPGCEELLGAVTGLPFGRGARPRPATHRRRLALAVAVLALAAIATAATWVMLRRAPARETTSVQCLIGTSDAVIPSFSGNPVHDCAVGYRQEYGTAPPRLRAYDNGLGGITVIPASRTPPAGWKPLRSQDVSLIELQDSLDDYISGLNARCLGSAAASRLVAAKLARFGFAGWTVKLRGTTTTPGQCFDMDIVDPSTRTVTLASFGGVAGQSTTEQKLADKLRPIAQRCESLPSAVASARAAAASLGLSESAKTYILEATVDNSLRCASIYETVGGTTFLTVRGPHG
jgi:hypothetical protein